MTPLELLNFYFSDGKSTGNKQSKLWRRFNERLTWDAILNKGYQVDLCPLLYYILTKWKPGNSAERLVASNAINTPGAPNETSYPGNPNALNALNSINQMRGINLIDPSEPSASNPVSKDLQAMSWPNDLIAKLRSYYYESLRRNMLLFDELARVLKAFNEANINIIVLKGASLAQSIYSDIALRPMGDVDLLIRKKDSNKAKKLLFGKGYELKSIPRYSKHFIRGYTFQLPGLRQRSLGFYLDLHWDFIVNVSANDIIEIWKGAMTKKVENITISQMLLEDLLLYICWHSAKHFFARLIWLCDISQIIRVYRGRINWQSLIEKTERWGIKKFTYYSLHTAEELFGGGVPRPILSKLRPGSFEIRIFSSISSKDGFEKGKIAPFNYILLVFMLLLSRDRVIDKIRVFLEYSCGAVLSRTKYMIRKRSISHYS